MSNQAYTTTTSPDLSSLGSLKDALYYRADEVQMLEVESQNNLGKYRKSLTSKSFSSIGDTSERRFCRKCFSPSPPSYH